MSRRFDLAAMARCEKLGLDPIMDPTGEDHHTDAPPSPHDKQVGEAVAWFLGGLFVDKEHNDPDAPLRSTYWYTEMTSVDVWTRVARALRVHGLQISNAEPRQRERI